jgi:plasmid stabilization system protein ParE
MLIRFHPQADIELHEAIAWYANKAYGLDYEFMRCIDEAICRIISSPETFPIALRNARKAMVRRFPYVIYYEVAEKELVILAVFHSKRSPTNWQRRTAHHIFKL